MITISPAKPKFPDFGLKLIEKRHASHAHGTVLFTQTLATLHDSHGM